MLMELEIQSPDESQSPRMEWDGWEVVEERPVRCPERGMAVTPFV